MEIINSQLIKIDRYLTKPCYVQILVQEYTEGLKDHLTNLVKKLSTLH